MFRLVEPNEETYALCVSEKDFSLFELFYTEAVYKTIGGEPLRGFKNHNGCFVVNKKEKEISFMETTIFSIYQDKEYGLDDVIKSDDDKEF